MSVIHVAIPMALPYGRSPSKLQDFTMAIPMAIRVASPIAIEVTSFMGSPMVITYMANPAASMAVPL